jgi:hypothetical protein
MIMRTIHLLCNACTIAVITCASFSCDGGIADAEKGASDRNILVRIGGALEASFDGDGMLHEDRVLIASHAGKPVLSMYFSVKTSIPNKQEEARIGVTLPFQSDHNSPPIGLINVKAEEEPEFSGSVGYTIVLHDGTELRAVYDFRASAGQLQITESSDTRLKGTLRLVALQVRGIRQSNGQLEEVTLANEGRIAVVVTFDVAVDRL